MLTLEQRNQIIINTTPLFNGIDWGEEPSYEYIEEMKKDYSPEVYKRYMEGHFQSNLLAHIRTDG